MAVRVIHIMADGKVLDSLKGVKIPVCKETSAYYNFMAMLQTEAENEQLSNVENQN